MSFLESPFNPMATFDSQNTLSSISSLDPKLSRTNYYDGRLLKASDLVRDQFYLDERLREVGRALGQGVVRGLSLTLTADRKLRVTPGLAITPSGRVLELEKETIQLNLTSDALINELNPGYRSLQAGIYAVVIRYAEKGVGSAEVYPRDLEGERGFHFNAYAEGVQFALVKLAINLPLEKLRQLSPEEISVYARLQLVRPLLIANPGQAPGIGEDAIALGLLGVEYGIPQWLDIGLVRRPFRNAQSLNYLQADLYNHYEELLKEILSVRKSSATREQFPAARYFSIMPPIGSIPKGAVDPVNGYQNFFPEAYEVSISPVREDDVPALLQQSLALEPIDLQTDRDVDIMIAVVLDDIKFSYIARQLQHLNDDKKDFVAPPHLDEFFLDSSLANIKASDNVSLWKNIWESARRVFYVRRPIRVAETQVSAVVLASGKYEELKNTSLPKMISIEALEEEIDGLSEANQALNQQLESLRQQIINLTAELNKPVDEKLKAAQQQIDELQALLSQANVDRTAILANVKELEAQVADLGAQLKQAQAEIEELKNTGGSSAEQDALKKQLQTVRDELYQVRNFIVTFLGMQELTVPRLSILARLRKPDDDKAVETMKALLDRLTNEPKLHSLLVQLLTLMPAVYDHLNWPTLEFLFAKEVAEKARDGLIEPGATDFLTTMLKLAEALGFPDEISTGWKKLVTSNRLRINVLIPTNVSRIRTLKPAQLLPATLAITTEDRDAITKAATADAELLKPLSQLKGLVPEQYVSALWASVPVLIENNKVQEFLDFVISVGQKNLPVGVSVAAVYSRFKLSAALRTAWADADLA